jgi:SAGA-associated factor 11
VADVASECHRIARLGLDRSVDAEEEELRSWATRAAAAGGAAEESGGGKGGVDVFGQTHPAIAADVVDCMNCGRPVVAGRFAPHLEKCIGKVIQLQAPSGSRFHPNQWLRPQNCQNYCAWR